MAIFCIHCGKELEDDAAVCPQCGNAVTEMTEAIQEPVTAPQDIPEEAPKSKKIKWWMIAIPVVAVIAIAAILFATVFGKVAPSVELYNAFQKTTEDLKVRFENSPFAQETDAETWSNGMTMDIEMDIALGFLGEMNFNISIIEDVLNNANATLVNVDIMGQTVQSGMYADKDRAVFAISDMFSGSGEVQYYGVNFATLEQDILKSPAFADATPEEREDFIKQIRAMQPTDITSVTDLSERIIEAAKKIVTDAQWVTSEETYSYQSKEYGCKTLSISLTSAQLAELVKIYEEQAKSASSFTDAFGELGLTSTEEDTEEKKYDSISDVLLNDCEGRIDCRFYLYEGKIFAIKSVNNMVIFGEKTNASFTIVLGENVATGDITIITETPTDEEVTETTYIISPFENEDGLGERIKINKKMADGDTAEVSFTYVWNKETGAFKLEKISTLSDFLMPTGSGVLTINDNEIIFQLDNLFALVDTGLDTVDLANMGAVPLSVKITNKATVVIPEFINLDEWDQNYAEQYN